MSDEAEPPATWPRPPRSSGTAGEWDSPLDVLAQCLRVSAPFGRAGSRVDAARLVDGLLDFATRAEREIEAQREKIAHLRALTTTDELTGIPNQRGFAEVLRRTLARARRHGETGVIAFLDVDDFKSVNDRHGHQAGDGVLRRIAQVLAESTRTSDLVARLHGDEFAVLLPRADLVSGHARLQVIRSRLAREPLSIHHATLSIHVSVGLAEYGPEAEAAALMRRADQDMYRHKRRLQRGSRCEIDRP